MSSVYPPAVRELGRRTLALGATASLALVLAGCDPAPTPRRTSAAGPTGRPATPAPSPTSVPEPTPSPTFDRAAHSVDEADSLWVVVDKRRPLDPPQYVPDGLVAVPVPHTNAPQLLPHVSAAVVAMFAAARKDGLLLASNSAYRSFDSQQRVHDANVASMGRKQAERLTLRPGFSEHQTGLAIDIGPESGRCSLNACLADLPEGAWLAKHAWRYGFVLRYPKGFERITGIEFEPWHFRYLGKGLARELHETGVKTLEQFFGLPDSPGYA